MDHKINLLDFSKMRIDVSRIEEGQLFLDVFPQFQHLKAYSESSEDEIKIAILLCDRSGPFSSIKNYEQRLNAIFGWLNYEPAGEKAELFQEVLTLRNKNVANIWTEYLAALFDHEWVSWFSNSVLYYQIMAEMRKPIGISMDVDDKDADIKWNKRKIIEDRAEQVYKKMKQMEDILFIDEAVKRRSAEREREKKIENYPEKYAVSNSVV